MLAEAGSSVERFFASGVLELKHKLGPVLWQLPPTKAFNPDDFTAFLELLPRTLDGRPIRHAVEVRHESFMTADYIALLRKHAVAPVLVDSEKHTMIADVTSDFVYARLQRTSEKVKTGYAPAALDDWAKCAETLPKAPRRRSRIACRRTARQRQARRIHLHDLGRQGARRRRPWR